MNMLTSLLGRILAGERYEPATKEDSRIWFSLLAAFPFPVMAAFLVSPLTKDASLPLVWLSWVFLGISFAGIWLFLFRKFQLKILGLIAAGAWLCAFTIAFTRV